MNWIKSLVLSGVSVRHREDSRLGPHTRPEGRTILPRIIEGKLVLSQLTDLMAEEQRGRPPVKVGASHNARAQFPKQHYTVAPVYTSAPSHVHVVTEARNSNPDIELRSWGVRRALKSN